MKHSYLLMVLLLCGGCGSAASDQRDAAAVDLALATMVAWMVKELAVGSD